MRIANGRPRLDVDPQGVEKLSLHYPQTARGTAGTAGSRHGSHVDARSDLGGRNRISGIVASKGMLSLPPPGAEVNTP
jgi:hypothetical protein